MIYIQLIFLIFYANSVALEGAAFAVFALFVRSTWAQRSSGSSWASPSAWSRRWNLCPTRSSITSESF